MGFVVTQPEINGPNESRVERSVSPRSLEDACIVGLLYRYGVNFPDPGVCQDRLGVRLGQCFPFGHHGVPSGLLRLGELVVSRLLQPPPKTAPCQKAEDDNAAKNGSQVLHGAIEPAAAIVTAPVTAATAPVTVGLAAEVGGGRDNCDFTLASAWSRTA